MPSMKVLKNRIPEIELRAFNCKVIVMHAIFATQPTECYSYSYCVGGSGI